jgi:shikimate dehydrogenase
LAIPQRRVLVGLIGRNIGASRSPWMHEQEGAAHELLLRYSLFDFAESGQDEVHLGLQIDAAERQGYAGLNITYPFKQSVIALLDELTPGANRVGAVNTVQFKEGRRIGHNTDVTGFAESLREGIPDADLNRVLQLGAGGAGAATAQALLEVGVGTLLVFDRETQRAAALARKLRDQFGATRADICNDAVAALPGVSGLVNATPVGMASHPGSPLDPTLLARHQWVADIVYFPLATALLIGARASDCQTLNGSGMAVYQAAAAFEIFTGLTANRERMRRSFMSYIPVAMGMAGDSRARIRS